jgi:hypothetical protein
MQKLIGGILLAVGGLIAGLSGLCTIVVVGGSLASPGEWTPGDFGGIAGSLMIVLIFGGIPFAIGAGLFLLGRSLLRKDREAYPAATGEHEQGAESPKQMTGE